MKRRTLLQYTTLATGAVVGAPLMSIILSGCQPEVVENYEPQFFMPEEFAELKKLIDVILPQTDSPSATEVGVHQIIDNMVAQVYDAEAKVEFKNKYTALSEYLRQADFYSAKKSKQLELLKNIDASEDESVADIKAAFLDIKQQTVAYYLSTKEIGTKYLNYLPVPGEYEACISVEEVGGKAWAI